jgi:hypothetical protein
VLFLELQVDGLEQTRSLLALPAAGRLRADAAAAPEASGLALPGRLTAVLLAAALLALTAWRGWRTRGSRRALGRRRGAAFRDGHLDLAGARALVERAEATLPDEEKLALLRCDLEEADFHARLDASAPYAELAEAAERGARRSIVARRSIPADPRCRSARPRSRTSSTTARAAARTGQRSIEALQAVLALDPLDVESHWHLGPHRAARRTRELRDEQVEIVFELEPDYALPGTAGPPARVRRRPRGRPPRLRPRRGGAAQLRDQGPLSRPGSSALLPQQPETVDLPAVRAHIRSLRQTLYF